MTNYVGLDVSLRETAICVVDQAGKIIREGKAESEPDAIAAWLGQLGLEFEHVGLEAGPMSPWLCEGLRAGDLPAVCIETRRMKGATAAMAVKTDRNDARAIAPSHAGRLVHGRACEDDREPGASAASHKPQDAAFKPGRAGERGSRNSQGLWP